MVPQSIDRSSSVTGQLPVIEDVLKCNEELNETLDADRWTSYLWTYGEETFNTQIIAVDESIFDSTGVCTVNIAVSNNCFSGNQDITVENTIIHYPTYLSIQ